MKIVFVEDRRADIDKVVTVLRTTGLFAHEDIEVLADYSEVDEECLTECDLFVLDVLIRGSDVEFTEFIRQLRRSEPRKPFIAFTTNSEHTRLSSLAGDPPPPLREVVLEHGGLGMIGKRRRHDDRKEKSLNDIQLDVVERVLAFYWSKK